MEEVENSEEQAGIIDNEAAVQEAMSTKPEPEPQKMDFNDEIEIDLETETEEPSDYIPEDDLIEEITTAIGWCIKSIDYDIQLK